MSNNYNSIAGIYDPIKTLIFGKSLILNEVQIINKLKFRNLLVVGCGSSEFLEYINLDKIERIVLLDSSKKMCEISSKRVVKLEIEHKCEVIFQNFNKWSSEDTFDAISFPYILDCLSDQEIDQFIEKSYDMCSETGKLVISDFKASQGHFSFSNLLIPLMYIFFKLTSGINRKYIPDYSKHINNKNWKSYIFESYGKYGLFSMCLEKKH